MRGAVPPLCIYGFTLYFISSSVCISSCFVRGKASHNLFWKSAGVKCIDCSTFCCKNLQCWEFDSVFGDVMSVFGITAQVKFSFKRLLQVVQQFYDSDLWNQIYWRRQSTLRPLLPPTVHRFKLPYSSSIPYLQCFVVLYCFVMCVCVSVCVCGFCYVWVCLGVGFVMCVCVCVWVELCVDVLLICIMYPDLGFSYPDWSLSVLFPQL